MLFLNFQEKPSLPDEEKCENGKLDLTLPQKHNPLREKHWAMSLSQKEKKKNTVKTKHFTRGENETHEEHEKVDKKDW